nr:hypothetical protein HmN_000804800 [Hymenolepis microstoma]
MRTRRRRRDSDNSNNGRNRRRWWLRWRSRPSSYHRPNPGWPPNYGSDTPQTNNISNREDTPPMSDDRIELFTPPPPYADPPPPYPSQKRATILASATALERREDRETVESRYGDTIYEFAPCLSHSELSTTTASSSELERRDRHPTSVYAGILRNRR